MFSLFRFDSAIESTAFTLARHLSKNNFVYYIDHPFTVNDIIKRRKTKAFQVRKRHFWSSTPDSIPTDLPNLKVVIPPVVFSINFLPEGWLYRRLQKVNDWLIRRSLLRLLRKLNIEEFVFINAFNFHYPGVSDGLNASLTMYYCLDPVIGSFDARHGRISENQILLQSDLVVCSSKQLYREKMAVNPNTFFVPNAADIHHSSRALDPTLLVSPVLSGIAHPVIGYFGSVERRIDYDLMRGIALQNPDFNFVFVGPCTSDVPQWFYDLPNVSLPGGVPYAEMPAVIKGFDVAIIPFLKDETSSTIFPLKLFEYLGAGKPVVATEFNPDLREITGDLVTYARDESTFSHAVREALTQDDTNQKDRRIGLAAQHTWEKRANTILKLLESAWALKHKC